MMENSTRKEIVHKLGPLRKPFSVRPPYFSQRDLGLMGLKASTDIDPPKSKFAFHNWVNHIFQHIVSFSLQILLIATLIR
jgi:hypothetical protein